MRKRFKIKNLIRNNRYIILSKGEGGHSPLLHTGYQQKRNGHRYIPSPLGGKVRMRGHKGIVESRQHRYAFLSRGEDKNLLANEMSLQILGGGQLCASNELTPSRISKFASSLRNSALPLGEGQTKSGGHSPLLHTGYPQKRNGHRHVMLNLFQHLATVEFHGYSKRLPQRRNIGQTLNQVQGDMKMLDCTPAKVQRRPLYIPSPPGEKVAGGRMRGQNGTLKNSKDPSPLPYLSQKQSTGMFLFGRVQGARNKR